MEIIYKIINLIILLLTVTGAQFLVRQLVGFFNKRIEKCGDYLISAIKGIQEKLETEKNFKEKQYDFKDFFKEITVLSLLKIQRKRLKFVTIIIGVIEIIGFSGLTVLLLKLKNEQILEMLITITQFAAGWIALKIFGSYKQWAGEIFGRVTFYVFLIGSILNIMFAVIIGIFIAKLL